MHQANPRIFQVFALLLLSLTLTACVGEGKDPAYDISGRWQPDGGMTCEGNTGSLVLNSLEAAFTPDRLEYVIEQDDHHATIVTYLDGVEIAEDTGLIYGNVITYSHSTAASYGTTTGTIEAADRIHLEDAWTNTDDDSEVTCSFILVPVEA